MLMDGTKFCHPLPSMVIAPTPAPVQCLPKSKVHLIFNEDFNKWTKSKKKSEIWILDCNQSANFGQSLDPAYGVPVSWDLDQMIDLDEYYNFYYLHGNRFLTTKNLTHIQKSRYLYMQGLVTTVSMGYFTQICKIFTYRVFTRFLTITAKRLTVATWT